MIMLVEISSIDSEESQDLPMNKDSSSSIQSLTYKGIGGREMLNDISVFIIVYID